MSATLGMESNSKRTGEAKDERKHFLGEMM
jgi:hypothetical protein